MASSSSTAGSKRRASIALEGIFIPEDFSYDAPNLFTDLAQHISDRSVSAPMARSHAGTNGTNSNDSWFNEYHALHFRRAGAAKRPRRSGGSDDSSSTHTQSTTRSDNNVPPIENPSNARSSVRTQNLPNASTNDSNGSLGKFVSNDENGRRLMGRREGANPASIANNRTLPQGEKYNPMKRGSHKGVMGHTQSSLTRTASTNQQSSNKSKVSNNAAVIARSAALPTSSKGKAQALAAVYQPQQQPSQSADPTRKKTPVTNNSAVNISGARDGRGAISNTSGSAQQRMSGSKRPVDNDLCDLEALVSQHNLNRAVRKKPVYEPTKHKVSDYKAWEALTGKVYMELSMADRAIANREVETMKKQAFTGKQ